MKATSPCLLMPVATLDGVHVLTLSRPALRPQGRQDSRFHQSCDKELYSLLDVAVPVMNKGYRTLDVQKSTKNKLRLLSKRSKPHKVFRTEYYRRDLSVSSLLEPALISRSVGTRSLRVQRRYLVDASIPLQA